VNSKFHSKQYGKMYVGITLCSNTSLSSWDTGILNSEGWIILPEEFHNVYSSLNIVRVVNR
jgi:hypothetical protein